MVPQVSLIISVYNKIDFLKLIFAGLEKQTFSNFEVVIADDGSGKDFVDELRKLTNQMPFKIKHIWHEDNGWRKNPILNKAVAASEGEYLIVIDGDCIPHPRFIEEHYKTRRPHQVICGRRVTLTEKISNKLSVDTIKSDNFHSKLFIQLAFAALRGENTHFRVMLHTQNKIIRRLFGREKQKAILGCNFSIFKEDLLSINGFDERFIYPGMGEDNDIDQRLGNIGVKGYSRKFLLPVYHIYHPHGTEVIQHEEDMNMKLFNENRTVGFTPYGLVKQVVE